MFETRSCCREPGWPLCLELLSDAYQNVGDINVNGTFDMTAHCNTLVINVDEISFFCGQ